jgi:uncharacterized protein (DUF1501 family)
MRKLTLNIFLLVMVRAAMRAAEPTVTQAAAQQAALLTDLRERGLLEETLVIFGSEFGRLPMARGPDGRDHNITGYAMFLAGAGVKKGFSYGSTDELGVKAVEGRMDVNDFHATLLALMGLNHTLPRRARTGQ